MATLDSKKDNPYYSNNDRDSFQKHDGRMKGFCLAHPKLEIKESKDITLRKRLTLVLLPSVKLGRCVQN